jgi:ABC-type Na+ efflux pump permease subunit
MIPTLAACIATTATITDGHAVIATHFAFAAWFTRCLFTILAACTRRHDALKVLV